MDVLNVKYGTWNVREPDVAAVNALASAANLLKHTAPRCPHLGCALNWNPEERSWDCTCHGSRFAEDGKLLDGPATGGIFTKNL